MVSNSRNYAKTKAPRASFSESGYAKRGDTRLARKRARFSILGLPADVTAPFSSLLDRGRITTLAPLAYSGNAFLLNGLCHPNRRLTLWVRAYKDLSKVERAFRCLKTVDLKVRPIYHWLADRVRAHVFLCMLAYYVEWHMRQKLAPILFDDEDKDLAETLRSSIVAPAERSPSAQSKDLTKRNEDGLPVHSFRSLLADLGTLAKNRIRIAGNEQSEFYMLTRPTQLQARVFELLGLSVSV
jgi:hypothetical protein